jgi:carbamoyl-phosphate synthase small subunit
MNRALLVLEDGDVFTGRFLGRPGEAIGEVVFATSHTGYQEMLTDPSFSGQILTLTQPHIGNYGCFDAVNQSEKIQAEGLLVRRYTPYSASGRPEQSLADWLGDQGKFAIEELDTRRLTLKLRDGGSQYGIIMPAEKFDKLKAADRLRAVPKMVGANLAKVVSTKTIYPFEAKGDLRIAVIDYGVKRAILQNLAKAGFAVTVHPWDTGADAILKEKYDALFLANGPGDPEPVEPGIRLAQQAIGKLPVFGICLGHQIMGLAMGAKTYKLKFGHRGANQPVQELDGKTIKITAQNHGFAVDGDSLKRANLQLTEINLSDNTVEGFKHKSEIYECVQYHPEASPGPHDTRSFFAHMRKETERFWRGRKREV